MRATFENQLHVTPETFFGKLFFDPAYNDGLYAELGFVHYEVLHLEQASDGTVERTVRAEPPVNAPGVVERKLRGKVYYTETGVYDPRTGAWTFESVPSMAARQTRIAGTITLEPNAQGAVHTCALEVQVRAFGLGSMIERTIEQNTRDSYRINTAYTNAFAREHGLLAPGAPR